MADTYGPIDAVYKTMYQENVQLQVQQRTAVFEGTFTELQNVRGKEMQAVEFVGKEEADLDYPEDGPTPNKPSNHEAVFVRPRRITWGKSIPSSTTIKAAVDYQSPYMQTGALAVARARRKIMQQAILGARLMKQDETGAIATVAFDYANRTVAKDYQGPGVATADAGLSVKKLIKGLELLGITELDIDVEDIHVAMTMKQNTDLYNDITVINKFYRDRAQLEDKLVRNILGINIHIWNTLPVDSYTATGARELPMWTKSGMYCGDAMPITTMLERNPAMQYQPHGFIENWFTATRSEDEKVARILCVEL